MSRVFVAVILILALAATTLAAERQSATSTDTGRTIISLDGPWGCVTDAGGQADWTKALPNKHDTVNLPYAWSQDVPALTNNSAVWYARDIAFPGAGDNVAVRLNLDHLVGTLMVYLDGERLAQLPGNGLPQHLQVSGKGGSAHRLTLRLERGMLTASAKHTAILGMGHLSMELLPPVRIDDLQAVADPAKNALIVRYRLSAEEAVNAGVRVEVSSADKKSPSLVRNETVVLTAAGVERETIIPIKRMRRWSPADSEKLYTVTATLVVGVREVDARKITCGTTDVAVDGSTLKVNGITVQLKGMRFPGGIPLIYRPSLEETLQHELELVRQSGFNAIMADGSALPEEALAVADYLGLYVIGEVPVGVQGPEIRATVQTCGQHPCIIAWSWAGSGLQDKQITELRVLDPSRPAIIRDGEQSQLLLPRSTDTREMATLDATLGIETADHWWTQVGQLDQAKRPVLVTGVGISTPSPVIGVRGNSSEGDQALGLLRGMVESLRRNEHFPLFGYFVRLPDAETMTGLCTPAGVPTNALTTAQAFNRTCTLALRAKTAVALNEETILDAAVVNDSRLTGPHKLYQVVTSVRDGKTSITTSDITLNGWPVQGDVQKYLTFTPTTAGNYRLQLVLAKGDQIVASTRVISISAGERLTSASQ